jgi:transcriptional regulator with XRE-family HTH domain
MTLDEWKRQLGLKQADFARLLNMDQGTVSRLLSGKRTPPSEVMRRIFVLSGGRVTANDWIGCGWTPPATPPAAPPPKRPAAAHQTVPSPPSEPKAGTL